MNKWIILGYGNPDRGDDGVAWHLLNELLISEGIQESDLFVSEITDLNGKADIWFNFQLLPEISELVAKYDRALFIDAHTGDIEEEINFEKIEPEFKNSPFTHHFSPSSCLALAESISGKYPEAWLLSVRGYDFEFSRKLSPKTRDLCKMALQKIHSLIAG
jgi:hydrogenase maturation protease